MNTLDHDATDDELTDALLRLHIGPALDALNFEPVELPDPRPDQLLTRIDPNILVEITLRIIREP